MNWLDYVILATLVLSTLVGVIRGVVREMLGKAYSRDQELEADREAVRLLMAPPGGHGISES